MHNLPPQLSYVSTLPDITQKPKSYVVFLSLVWVSHWLWKEPVVRLYHSRCLFAFTHARSNVCHWSMASSM